ncbi:hypothetical protein CFP56_011732 [Quercus suber]|uniref:Uncharacterized protein n=1 Tax=Quercus suber TaxID=58331 RepID=A0AAW0KWR1_QUESU
MVFKKLVCFIYNHLIGNGDHLRAQPTFWEAPSLLHHKVSLDEIEVEVEVEVEGEVVQSCVPENLPVSYSSARMSPAIYRLALIFDGAGVAGVEERVGDED